MGQLKKLDFPGVVFNLAKFPEVKACFLQSF